MKRILTIALLALATLAGQAQIHYRIEGNIGRPEVTDTLILSEMRGREIDGFIACADIDTLYVVNGEIIPREGTLSEPMMVNGWSRNRLQLIHLMLADGTTQINGTIGTDVFRQSGNPLADAMNQMEEEYDALVQDFKRILSGTAPVDTMALLAREDSFVVSVLRAHPCDDIGSVAMLDYAVDICTFMPRRGLELLAMMDTAWVAKNPKLLMMKRDLEQLVGTSEGCMFRDFAVEYDGKTTRLSNYVGRGQYVLADFWASWCGPCRREIPNIIAAYNKYKDKGLVVLGIATWDEPEKTLKAIKEEGITYPQMLNVQKIATDLYGINGIPEIILFAPDGTILARGLRGEGIEKRLAEIFVDK